MEPMKMERRPTSKETEEDLLEMQRQFLQSAHTPSARLVNLQKRTTENVETIGQKRPKISAQVEEEADETRRESPVDLGAALISDVVERDVTNEKVTAPTKPRLTFPEVIRLDRKTKPVKGQSLFAQHMAKIKPPDKVPVPDPKLDEPSGDVDEMEFGSSSRDEQAQMIHEQNLKIIGAMDEREILKEREKLLKTMDPTLIDFLKKRNLKGSSRSENVKGTARGTQRSASGSSAGEQRPPFEAVAENLPIEPSEAQRWLHMSEIETDKLSWMVDPPKLPPEQIESGYDARFNFEGELMSCGEDVPTHEGLHHHGDEPQLAGYTLHELIQYSRSSVGQQRVLALRTMGNVLKKTKLGLYDNCLDASILPKLLDAGTAVLLRTTLDDGSEGTRDAAVYALHCLVVSEPDELCLDVTCATECRTRFLHVEAETASDGELEEMSDVEIFQRDCIEGLLRTDILQRFDFIVRKRKPPAPVVNLILDMLIRIARHSLKSCHDIFKVKNLMRTIVTHFMPLHWDNLGESDTIDDVYGVPLPLAVKLVRVLASASRNVATALVEDFRVVESLLRYVSLPPTDLTLPTKHGLHLILESLRTWKILLSYNLGSQLYINLFPLVMKQLHSCVQLSIDLHPDKSSYDHEYVSTLLAALGSVVEIAASHSHYANKMSFSSGEVAKAPPIVEWNHVEGLWQPVLTCVQKWLHEATTAATLNHSALKLMGSAFNFLAVFWSKYAQQSTCSVIVILEEMENLFRNSVAPFLRSSSWRTLLLNHQNFSNLLCERKCGTSRDFRTLPSLGSMTWGGTVVPVLNVQSPLFFLEPFMNLAVVMVTVHKQLCNEISPLVLSSPLTLGYLRKVLRGKGTLAKNWFTRYETRYVYHLVKLAAMQLSHERTASFTLFHHAALAALSWAQSGDERLALDLLSTVVFNPSFWSDDDNIVDRMREMALAEDAAKGPPSTTRSEQALLVNVLPSLRSTYLQWFKHRHPSCSQTEMYPTERTHVTLRQKSVLLLPPDWPYLLIKDAWLSARSQPVADTKMILRCLQWLCVLECCEAPTLAAVPSIDKFCYLGCVFLIANDLFLEPEIRTYLEQLCIRLAASLRTAPLDARKRPLPASTSFRDFYLQLINQFEAVSYGDDLFGLMLMLAHHDLQFRVDLWIEHATVLQYITFSPEKFPIHLKSYLFPLESDEEVLEGYRDALVSGLVRKECCPLPYRIAVHHLHHFLFEPTGVHPEMKNAMLEKLTKKHPKIAKEVQLYKG